MKRWRTTIIVAVVLIFNPVMWGVAWIGGAWWSDKHPETGTKLGAVEWLPQSATEISYYKTYSWNAWECTIKEDDFRQWAARYQLREIDDAQSIPRFSWMVFLRSRQGSDEASWSEEERKHVATIHKGLFATERRRDGGGYQVVFDRETNRAYFQSNPR